MIDELSDLLKEEERIAEARGPLDTPEQIESDNYNSTGWELHCEERFEEAIKQFDKAININPRHALAINNKGLSLRRLGRFEEAIDCFDQAIAVAPKSVKPYSNKGQTLGMMGRSNEAAVWFKKALEVEPGYPRAIQGLQQYCGRLPSKDDEQQIENLFQEHQEAMQIAIQGQQYVGVAHFEEALQLFNKALQISPDVPDILGMKADCLCNMGRLQEALECAIKATELNPKLASAWVSRAWANLGMSKFEESHDCAEQAISLDPNHDMAYNNSGAALMMLGRYNEAVERFNQALSLNQNNPIAKMNLDACLRKIEPPEFMLLGLETIEVAKAHLEQGHRVAVSFDFSNPSVDWQEIITLSQRYERLTIIDILDRSVDQIREMAHQFQSRGANRLTLDMSIRAQEKSRNQKKNSI